jgi:catechol 2,3-dioxygenase-like lactoylglutathione lyase family enzyme
VPPRPTEISLRCGDLERSLAFYRDLLGLPLEESEGHEGDEVRHFETAWGTPGEQDFMMMILWAATPGESTTRAYVGFRLPRLAALHDSFVAAGVPVIRAPRMKPWGLCAEYLDPDGNTVFLNEETD